MLGLVLFPQREPARVVWDVKELTSSLSRRQERAKDGTSDMTTIEGRSSMPMKDKRSSAVCPDGSTGSDPPLVRGMRRVFSKGMSR